MFRELDVRRTPTVTLALSQDNHKIIVKYFVNRARCIGCWKTRDDCECVDVETGGDGTAGDRATAAGGARGRQGGSDAATGVAVSAAHRRHAARLA